MQLTGKCLYFLLSILAKSTKVKERISVKERTSVKKSTSVKERTPVTQTSGEATSGWKCADWTKYCLWVCCIFWGSHLWASNVIVWKTCMSNDCLMYAQNWVQHVLSPCSSPDDFTGDSHMSDLGYLTKRTHDIHSVELELNTINVIQRCVRYKLQKTENRSKQISS